MHGAQAFLLGPQHLPRSLAQPRDAVGAPTTNDTSTPLHAGVTPGSGIINFAWHFMTDTAPLGPFRGAIVSVQVFISLFGNRSSERGGKYLESQPQPVRAEPGQAHPRHRFSPLLAPSVGAVHCSSRTRLY